jgi:hypothetical protein
MTRNNCCGVRCVREVAPVSRSRKTRATRDLNQLTRLGTGTEWGVPLAPSLRLGYRSDMYKYRPSFCIASSVLTQFYHS